ncbi:unnamed protein product, partial [Ectocarpus sp. 13 AM-2016]
MRKLEAAGVGGVAAAQELTRRVLCGTGVVVGGGEEVAGKGDKIGVRPLQQEPQGEMVSSGGSGGDTNGVVESASSSLG